MSCPLPPEIFDLVIDHLHGNTAALRACSFVSKSWVPRAQRCLFAYIKFANESSLESWMRTFPDPSNSPAHHVRTLSIRGIEVFARVNADACVWLCSFNNVETLFANPTVWDTTRVITLAPLHRLSPTLKSLHLFRSSIPLPDILDLICSFPLLEDLLVGSIGIETDAHNWGLPQTSPKLTGSLHLTGQNRLLSRKLVGLPDGIHLSKILVRCSIEDAALAMELVKTCYDTLEYLTIEFYPLGVFSSNSVADRYLTLALDLGPPQVPPLDLSNATKLKGVRFDWNARSVRWITTTLQTARSNDLRRITLYTSAVPPYGLSDGAEWLDLDRLLDELWTSRSTLPKILFGGCATEIMRLSFPKLASKGAMGEVRK